MAEAAVDRPHRFYCHQCLAQINPKIPEFTCPTCDSGFIEEMTDDFEESSPAESAPDPAQQFAELWGRTFLESFRRNTDSDDSTESGSSSESGPHSHHRQHPNIRQIHIRTGRPIAFRRMGARQDRHPAIDTIIHQLLGGLAGGAVFHGGIPLGMPLHGNPGDYAWGAQGLDSIITQLLNQLEGCGPPPASQDRIDAIPTIRITHSIIEKNSQCSVCFEDFRLDEKVRQLPCQHCYHNDCIEKWLVLHGTCPVCRKTLDGEDTSDKEYMPNSDNDGENPSDLNHIDYD